MVAGLCLCIPARSQNQGYPRVFRGDLQEKARMVFVALNPEMTLAYDEEGCGLYLAWKGEAQPASGPGRPLAGSAAAGPVFRADGPEYHRRMRPRPWSVQDARGNVPVTPKLESAGLADGRATLEYSLPLPGGRKIRVRERIAYEDHYGDRGIFRYFSVEDIPKGSSLRLELSGRGMPETWGGGATGRLQEEGGDWRLIQDADGETPIKAVWSQADWPGRGF